MTNFIAFMRKWGLSILLMLTIFIFSSTPSQELPNFSWADTLVKKGGHMLGFGLLALSYAYGLGWDKNRWWLPWLLVIAYALSDEFHQSFVPGRHATLIDVGIDGSGAGLALLIKYRLLKPNLTRRASISDEKR